VRRLGLPPDWLAGYVRLPTGHPWAGSPDHLIPVDVHGDITYIEHTDQAGWIGFDTMCINRPSGHSRELATWTMEEAVVEPEQVAEQVAAARRRI
jgi:hypothetical protein